MQSPVLIVYTSLTGCTEQMAQLLADELRQKNISSDLRHCTESDPQDFLNYKICIVGTYTYGAHGDLPDEIVDFYFDLEQIDLAGRHFAVLGSGDYIYEFFCKSVDDFDKKMRASGGIQLHAPIKFELEGKEKDRESIKILAGKIAKILLQKK